MKIIEAINQIDNLKPNTYTQEQKVYWLSQLDSMVKRLVIDTHEGGNANGFSGYTRDTDLNTEMLLPAPFDMCYMYWLEAQIHYANEDIDMYNSAIMMFNASFSQYKADYKRSHATKRTGRFRY